MPDMKDWTFFKAGITEMKPKATDHFYKQAVNALQEIKIRYNPTKK